MQRGDQVVLVGDSHSEVWIVVHSDEWESGKLWIRKNHGSWFEDELVSDWDVVKADV